MPTPIGRRTDACYADDEPDLSCRADPATHDDETTATAAWPVAAAPAHADAAAPDCDRIPDYVTLSAGGRVGLSVGDAYTIDRYGNRYGSVSVGFATPGPSVSSTAGYLRDPAHPCEPPKEEKLESFLTGTSRTEIISAGLAEAYTTSGNMHAYEIGVGTPGAAVTVGYGWLLHDEKHGDGSERP